MIELAVTLVVIGAFVALFRTQAIDVSKAEGTEDLAAQARLDTVANAIYTAHRPGVNLGDMTFEDLSGFTNAPLREGPLPAVDGKPDRRWVSIAFGSQAYDDANPGIRTIGTFGLASMGRTGSCWLLKGRVGLTGQGNVALQTAEHQYFDYPDDLTDENGASLNSDELARLGCTGETALLSEGGGQSWQVFTNIDTLFLEFEQE